MPRKIERRKRRVIVNALIERDGWYCTWCCRPMVDLPIDPKKDCSAHMTLEHIVPRTNGGTNDMANLALACFGCNNARGSDLEWVHEDLGVLADSCVL